MHLAGFVLAATSLLLAQSADVTYLTTYSGDVEYPARVAAAPGGGLYVTDPPNSLVVELDPSGSPVGSFLIPEGPIGIAVHPTNGNRFVSRMDGQVGIYDATFVQTGALDPAPFAFANPNDLAVHPVTGEVFVADSGAHRILVFDGSTGTLVRMWGTEGQGLAAIESPLAVAIDPSMDRVIVADTDNFRIQIFETSGVFLLKFGYRTAYTDTGTVAWVARSTGVAVDACSNIYVADALMGTVRVFKPTGVDYDINNPPIVYGPNPGDLRLPGDLAIDGSTLYVTSTNASSIEVYGIDCTVALRDAPPAAPHGSGPLAGLASRPAQIPDNPFAIVEAIRTGRYERALDLDRNLRVDIVDLEIAVASFGGANLADFLRTDVGPTDDSGHPFDEPPHMHHHEPPLAEYPWICSRCHNMTGAPGDMLTDWGQENLCLSCHSGARQAMAMPIGGEGKGNSHPWGVPAAGGGVLGPASGSLLAPHLDAGDIRCGTCHDPHTSTVGVPYLRLNNVAGALCKECHRGDGAPIEHGRTFFTYCAACHDAHAEGPNLSLVGGMIGGNEVVFTDNSVGTGAGGFVDPDPNVFGPCEACHPFPDGVPPHTTNPPMGPCVECHPHANGFLPTGGGSCVGCHSVPQDNGDGVPVGGRRAAAAEFPSGDAHAHYGADAEDGCVVCHDQSTHMDGYVDLIDPDGGPNYRFVFKEDLTSDPDLSNFCAACHDADGAAGLGDPFDPFGNGNIPPDVDTKFQGSLAWEEWFGDFCFGEEGTLRAVNSHHDLSDADQLVSGAKLECLNCHGGHASSLTQPVADPFDPVVPWSGTDNAFCLSCHSGGAGPTDPGFPPGVAGPTVPLRGIDSCDYTSEPWYVDYDWTHSAHGLDSKRGWLGYSGAPAYELLCRDCHDPHGSYSPTNPVGNPYMIVDFVDGTGYIDDGARTAPIPPPWTTGIARDVVVSVAGTSVDWGSDVGLCKACHVNWLAAYDWHDFCDGCQTCHGHGQAFGEHDWGTTPGDENTPCPIPLQPMVGGAPGGIPIHRAKPQGPLAPAPAPK